LQLMARTNIQDIGGPMNMQIGWIQGLLLVAALSSACVAARPKLGEAEVRTGVPLPGAPVTMTVEEGRVFNADVDVASDAAGCLTFKTLVLCREQGHAPGAATEVWKGSASALSTELSPGGDELRVIWASEGKSQETKLLLGTGKQWDEVRKHPAPFALAASLSSRRHFEQRDWVLPATDPRPAPAPAASGASDVQSSKH
jgi:hypothetical protein